MSSLRLENRRQQIARPNLRAIASTAQQASILVIAKAAIWGIIAISMLGLILTIATSQGVYEIAKLKAEQKNLSQSTAIYGAEVDSLSSPQNLANAAVQLGMVANSTPVFLSIEKQTVYGKPSVALVGAKNKLIENLVPNSQMQLETSIESLEKSVKASKPAAESSATNVASSIDAHPELGFSGGGIPASPTN